MGRKAKTSSAEGLAASVEGGKSEAPTGAVYETSGESAGGFMDNSKAGESMGGGFGNKPKISIPLRDDGGIDLDSMRASTRAKLESAVRATPSLNAPAGSPLSEKDCEYLLSVVSGVRVFAAIKFLGIPKEIAESVIPYNPEQVNDLTDPLKETAASMGVGLMPPWARLLMVAGAIDMGNMMEIKIQLAKQKARAAVAGPVPVAGGLQ